MKKVELPRRHSELMLGKGEGFQYDNLMATHISLSCPWEACLKVLKRKIFTKTALEKNISWTQRQFKFLRGQTFLHLRSYCWLKFGIQSTELITETRNHNRLPSTCHPHKSVPDGRKGWQTLGVNWLLWIETHLKQANKKLNKTMFSS